MVWALATAVNTSMLAHTNKQTIVPFIFIPVLQQLPPGDFDIEAVTAT